MSDDDVSMNQGSVSPLQIADTPTDINVLMIPFIFSTPYNYREMMASSPDGRYHRVIEWKKNRTVTIDAPEPLVAVDRKTFIAIEHLYYKKNTPSFESPTVKFTFQEIAEVLNLSVDSWKNIWNSIQRIFNTNVTFYGTFPDYEGLHDAEQISSLLPISLTQESGKTALYEMEKSTQLLANISRINEIDGPRGAIQVTLQNWHVGAFKTRYYRLINRKLYQPLRSHVALITLDHINANGYYLNKNSGAYNLKKDISLAYEEYCKMCGLKPLTRARDIKKQLLPLNRLVEVGALVSWDVRKKEFYDSLPHFTVYLQLGELEPKVKAQEMKKETSQYNKLISLGLTSAQALAVTGYYDSEYIEGRIKQAVWMRDHKPSAYQKNGYTFPGYLYNSLRKKDWIESDYIDALNRASTVPTTKETDELIEKKEKEGQDALAVEKEINEKLSSFSQRERNMYIDSWRQAHSSKTDLEYYNALDHNTQLIIAYAWATGTE